MITDITLLEIQAGLKTKTFSRSEVLAESFANYLKFQPVTNALITQNYEEKHKDDQSQLPYILKDSYITKNLKTTAASKVLDNFIPPYNSTVSQKLEAKSCYVVGKANMDAWGHGGSSENTDFGPVKNPYDSQRVAGGSSGGAAVAVATGMALFAIGEDTGGSIRNPANWTNTCGLKVSYGRVSRYGCIAYASSFDTVGPMARSVADLAYILEIIAGRDPLDATSSPQLVPSYTQNLAKFKPHPKKIGIPRHILNAPLDPQIRANLEIAIDTLSKAGYQFIEIPLPLLEFGVAIYYLIAPCETSSNLARYDGVRYGKARSYFTKETSRRILIGTYALSAGYYDAYYKQALKARTLLIKEYEQAFTQCDLMFMPVMPTLPPKLGEQISDPVLNLMADTFTVTQNIVGVPSLAIPCGFSTEGLPIGMQLVGPMFSENLLLEVGYHYQQLTSWHQRKPTV